MNFDDYKNKLPYPTRRNTDHQRRCIDSSRLTHIERVQALNDMDAETQRLFAAEKEAYTAESKRLRRLFELDCEAESGLKIPDKAHAFIHGEAWERAHCSSYSEVHNEYVALASLVNNVLRVIGGDSAADRPC